MANYNNPYGNYNPYGYSPFGNNYQPNNYPQNNPQGYPQSNQQLNQYAFVNGIEGAKSYQLQPNQSIMLMDSDNLVCYMKQTNSIGQATLRYFKLTEVSENDLKAPAQPQLDANNYVLKSDFNELSKRLDNLYKKLEKPVKNENFKGNKVEE